MQIYEQHQILAPLRGLQALVSHSPPWAPWSSFVQTVDPDPGTMRFHYRGNLEAQVEQFRINQINKVQIILQEVTASHKHITLDEKETLPKDQYK